MNLTDTIVAISTAGGTSSRIIVRASGDRASELLGHLCPSLSFIAAQATFFHLNFAGLSVPGWVYTFRSPHSYTREDVVEFHLPGSTVLAKMLLNVLLQLGARLAEPGEFTARAFFSGAIGLTEAEGVAAVISAGNERELAAARQLLAGELSRRLQPVLDVLLETLALVEVGIDFSEEDVSFLTQAEVRRRCESAVALLNDLVEQSARFDRLSHEPVIVLAGRPNAGKSTLLNALAGHERAVVSSVAGTTRDVLSARVELTGGPVQLIDIAGLDAVAGSGDSSIDDVERQMQERAHQAMASADAVVLVMDVTDRLPAPNLPRTPDLVVRSKADLAAAGGLCVSAYTGDGIARLRRELNRIAFGSDTGAATLALNTRHVQELTEAQEPLHRAALLAETAGGEVLALELREALDALGRVLGEVTPDDVLGKIFGAFCIGK